ncbi:4-hydroxythreonine-4-phosphate dehydrogenase PdxA [Asticcacaulis sp. 201]|uniref:4-hydroxythreonine-4-phosphate dehydrogenase PdxA n=1 Tax=Asticcacaulis sp. 201 TaxID=3028787 RepID=UPI002916C2AC|nr:4-hydroxythreonine-4-phosphate dehydrogenase PdxA [Asticcacaulis sp. 201]MDV6329496.1 4-hydroxythreonine-4-phosphate dehydrogenase PdxA [Asticcacaulis sp. 201]
MTNPPLVVSLGDPAGIGPELAAKAWTSLRDQAGLAFCVLGDAALLETHGVPVARVADVSETSQCFASALPVLDTPLTAPVAAGKPDSRNAQQVIDWIRQGVDLCRSGQARGLVTCPIAKSVLYSAGFRFPGHTEYLAELCRDGDTVPMPVMMLTAKDLRVVLATIHVPLKDVPDALTVDGLVELARITYAALRQDFGLTAPRLVMCGLNPHAGEDGTIGREEVEILNPAIDILRNESIDIAGPFPSDSLFHDEARRSYDAVLCMYHDQGLIPLKTIDFWGGVNITLGLPIVRTSPDHGTGFDIAGKGLARADSLLAAIRAADMISRNRVL